MVLADATGPLVLTIQDDQYTNAQDVIPGDWLDIYPNPFSDELHISCDLDERGVVKIALIDMTGHVISIVADKIMEAGVHRFRMGNKQLPEGTYFLKISSSNDCTIRKIIHIK
jgi:hypothetical protein